MSTSFQKNSAGILASLIIGLIILSFMFTGYHSDLRLPTSSAVATVDGTAITTTEYQRALAQRLEMFRKMLGGKELTNQQLEQFGIKQAVLKWLVEQKVLSGFAQRIGLWPGREEIAAEIQEQPYFKTNNQFDVQLYKELLMRNGITPTDFEKSIGEGVAVNQLQNVLSSYPVLSEGYLKEIQEIKGQTLAVKGINISKNALEKFIEIPEAEIRDFINKPENKMKLEAHFLARKSELDQLEQVKARHILVTIQGLSDKDKSDDQNPEEKLKQKIEQIRKTVTPQNFAAIADKETEDPSGKGKGGNLGWFGKGRMVPEFEKVAFTLAPGSISEPIKTPFGYHILYVEEKKEEIKAVLEDFKNPMAKEILQKQNKNKAVDLENKIAQELKETLLKDQKAEVESAQMKYGSQVVRDQTIDLVNGEIEGVPLESKQLDSIFSEKFEGEKAFVFNNVGNIVVIVASTKLPNSRPAESDSDKEKMMLSQLLRKDLQEYLVSKSTIKTNDNML